MRRDIRKMDGWIKLHRKLLENPVVMKDSLHMALWMYLLLNAAYEKHPYSVGGEPITLKPGEVVVYPTKLAAKFKVDKNTLNRTLNEFETHAQVTQKKYPKGRVVTVLKWGEYQEDAPKTHLKRTQDEPETHPNKEERNKNNILFDSNESNCRSPDRRGDAAAVIDAWNKIPWVPAVQRIATDSKRGKMLNARLNEYGLEKTLEAVSQARKSEFLKDKAWFNFDWFVKPNNFPKVLEGAFGNRDADVIDKKRGFHELQGRWQMLKDVWGGKPPDATDGEVFWDICTGGAVMNADADVDYDAAMLRADTLLGTVSGREGGELGAWLIQESQKSGLKKRS